ITRGEFSRLENGEARINRAEARARADGVVTPAERNHINSLQNRESREIYRDRHNDQVGGGASRPQPVPASGTTHNWNTAWQYQPTATGTHTSTTVATSPPNNWSGQSHMA